MPRTVAGCNYRWDIAQLATVGLFLRQLLPQRGLLLLCLFKVTCMLFAQRRISQPGLLKAVDQLLAQPGFAQPDPLVRLHQPLKRLDPFKGLVVLLPLLLDPRDCALVQ